MWPGSGLDLCRMRAGWAPDVGKLKWGKEKQTYLVHKCTCVSGPLWKSISYSHWPPDQKYFFRSLFLSLSLPFSLSLSSPRPLFLFLLCSHSFTLFIFDPFFSNCSPFHTDKCLVFNTQIWPVPFTLTVWWWHITSATNHFVQVWLIILEDGQLWAPQPPTRGCLSPSHVRDGERWTSDGRAG